MPIYAVDDLIPVVDQAAFVHPTAVLIGDVIVSADFLRFVFSVLLISVVLCDCRSCEHGGREQQRNEEGYLCLKVFHDSAPCQG